MTLHIPHSIFNLARLLHVRPETFGPYYVYPFTNYIMHPHFSFGFNQKKNSVNFLRRNSCHLLGVPVTETNMMILYRWTHCLKKSFMAVNTSESIHFIHSECFGNSSKFRLKPENVVHSENSVPTKESKGNFSRNSENLNYSRTVCDSICNDIYIYIHAVQQDTQNDFNE